MSWLSDKIHNWIHGRPSPAPSPPVVPPSPIPMPPSSVPTILLAIVNRERKAAGLDRLDLDSRLLAAAQGHSEAMMAAGVMDHQVRGEQPLGIRVGQSGYAWSRAYENIGEEDTAVAVVQKWMSDRGHRENLLSSSIHVGFGLAISWSGKHYWTAVMASPIDGDAQDKEPDRAEETQAG